MINLTDPLTLEKIINAGEMVLKSNESLEVKTNILKIQVGALSIQRELLQRSNIQRSLHEEEIPI